ncbi:MAG: hypothetical protein WB615_04460 [Candidatus Tumulicola sp.]
MSVYGEELAAAELQGRTAFEAMDAWASRPLDAPDVSGAVLEGYAKQLRESRERLRKLQSEQGVRDDIAAALGRNEAYHRRLGLSIRDKPDEPPQEEA